MGTYLLEKGMKEEEVDEAEQVQQDEEVEGKKRMMSCRNPLSDYNQELDLQSYQQTSESVAHKIVKDYDRLLAEDENFEEQNQDDIDAVYRKQAPTNIHSIKNHRKTFLVASTKKGVKEALKLMIYRHSMMFTTTQNEFSESAPNSDCAGDADEEWTLGNVDILE